MARPALPSSHSSPSSMLRLLLTTSLVADVAAHGSLVIPQTRNAIDRYAPQWKGGYPSMPRMRLETLAPQIGPI